MKTSTLKDILAVAAQSPSSHNTQPWKVRLEGDELVVGYEPSRQLLIGDPALRELYISLGCFIESIVLAAEDIGLKATCIVTERSSTEVARISFSSTTDKTASRWTDTIQSRRSDRSFYSNKKVPSTFITSVAPLSSRSVKIQLFEQAADIEFLSDATYRATLYFMSQKSFRRELASWVRNNWTKQHDGMPAYTQGMPGPISLLAKFFIQNIPAVPKDQAKKDSARVTHSACIGIISAESESVTDLIATGRIYQRTCLTALLAGIKTAAVSAAVIYPSTSQEIKTRLNISGQPLALIRFGYSETSPKASPRRSVDEILV